MTYKNTFLLMTLFALSTSAMSANEADNIDVELPPLEQCQQYAQEDGIENADLPEYIQNCLNDINDQGELIEGSSTEEMQSYENLSNEELCHKYAQEDNIEKQEMDTYLASCLQDLNTPEEPSQN